MKLNQNRSGKVYLVGAGPGDPGLLTLKARDLIADADCVIYDYLVNPKILEHAPAGAELIYAGKRGLESSQQLWTQVEINRLLVAKANEHEVVVRLKGGDPFIFGRGGEEAEALVEAGIEWEVVPGVSAGSSVAAYAGIPITHRGDRRSIDLERARRRYAGGGHTLGDVRPSGDGRLESGRGRGGGQTQEAHVSRANRRRRSRSAARKIAVVRRGGQTRRPAPT